MIFIILLAVMLYGEIFEVPPIVNPKFKHLTKDPVTQTLKPYMWEVDLILGPNDEAFLRSDVVGGQRCLGMHVLQDGAEDGFEWATIHVRQDLRGRAAQTVFGQSFTVAVFPTFSYVQDAGYPRNVFGLEIFDGTHLLWVIFSDRNTGIYQISQHRIIVVQTTLNEWSLREISLAHIYESAGWKTPSAFSFTFLVGATRGQPGRFAGFVKEIDVAEQREAPTSRSSTMNSPSLEALILCETRLGGRRALDQRLPPVTTQATPRHH